MYIFFFNDTATTEIYTLSLHDALPICRDVERGAEARLPDHHSEEGYRRPCRQGAEDGRSAHPDARLPPRQGPAQPRPQDADRKSTRLNSSHANISYAVFCLKKKKISIQ